MKRKIKYIKPTVSILFIEMENSISAGSNTTRPNNIVEEWDETEDEARDIPW